MKSWRRSQWIENKSREYLEIPIFHKKDDRKGLNTLFVKISTLTSQKRQISEFSVLNLEIWNSNVMKSWRRSQWIENKSREYLEIPIFHKKDDRKGLNTLFVKISTLTSQKRQISEFFCVKSWNLKFQCYEKLKKKPMNRK